MSHDIFISYSRKDISDVKAIKEELEKHDFSCWMDLTGIVSGTRRFSKTIIDAIEASRTMLFFLSSNSQQSEWALKEIDYAMEEKKNVVLLRFNDDPMTKEFRFDFGRTDIIDWRIPEQKGKLLHDLAGWSGKSLFGEVRRGLFHADGTTASATELEIAGEGNGKAGTRSRAGASAGRIEEEFSAAYEAYKKQQYSVSFPIFFSLAERGFARAFGYLGLAYEQGEGVPKNLDKAVFWYEKAIEEKEHLGVYRLGMLYRAMGRDELAFRVYKTAAEDGWADGKDHLLLGEMLEKGQGTKRDFARATEHYRMALNTAFSSFDKQNAREGLARLGELFNPEDFEVALPPKLQRASPETLYEAGEKNLSDFDHPDKPLAFSCFKAAAEKGHALAACRLSMMYADSDLPIHDTGKAGSFGAIASAGMIDLCRKVPALAHDAGYAYQHGEGCTRDIGKAQACYQIGAAHDDEHCLWRLGLILQGEGLDEEAFRHLLKAAELGQGMAMYEVAQCYEKGLGTERDRGKALLWYQRCVKSRYAASHDAEIRLAELAEE